MKKLDKTAEHFRKNEVSALIEISKMYTQKDLCEFAEWCMANYWKHGNDYVAKYPKLITEVTLYFNISQLREIWEVETGRREK